LPWQDLVIYFDGMTKDSNSVPAIKVSGIKKSFIKRKTYAELIRHPFTRNVEHALDGVDLTVSRGGLYALLGPNGAGKSTFLRVISGVVTQDFGTVELFGERADAMGQRRNAVAGLVVGDERSFYLPLTVRQNLEFFAAMHGLFGAMAHKRIDEVLEMVDLVGESGKGFAELSGGMKQRMSLARGLIPDPPILLFDEITRGLDPGHAMKFRRLVRDRLSRVMGRTIIFATHNLAEARELSDQVVLLDNGKVAAAGLYGEVEPSFNRVFCMDDDAGGRA
jgi:ABC-2 type transport system ATP-binding protein